MPDPQSAELTCLIEQVQHAHHNHTALTIRGGDTKRFYGRACQGEPLDVTPLQGIVSYEPSELVITARCGTPLQELEYALAERKQCLAFEPPHFAAAGSVGGMVATGLSGPARASRGAVRDHVLGAVVLDSRGEVLRFGGQVIKNVAGYDISRLLCGSLGTLGVLLEASLRTSPIAPGNQTLQFEMDSTTAIDSVNRWIGQALPVDASAWHDGILSLRLRGALAAVADAVPRLGAEPMDTVAADIYWRSLRDHTHDAFTRSPAPLWRLSVPATTGEPILPDATAELIEWHGAQRWFRTQLPAEEIFRIARHAGGHATQFRGDGEHVFTPLDPVVKRIHQALKQRFDPAGIFNPGRMYPGL